MKQPALYIGFALCAAVFISAVHAGDNNRHDHGPSKYRTPPLVYDDENTGARYPEPAFPSFDQLPIIRPLPDPFRFFNTRRHEDERDTRFSSWERRRNEIKAAIEKYEIGHKPDCSDCTITANYVPA